MMETGQLPTSQSPLGGLFVIIGGLITTVVTLGVVIWLATQTEFELMGFYFWFIIPVGAIAAGIGAGSGYGALSWMTGRKIGGLLLMIVVVLQLFSYGAAQFAEYKAIDPRYEDTGESVSFTTYYDHITRSMTFSTRRSKTTTSELGALGYGVRLLEVIGFTLGGLIVPLVLSSKPYCEQCNVYMKTNTVGSIPAGIPTEKIKKKDTEAMQAYESAMEEAFNKGVEIAQSIGEAAEQEDLTKIQSHMNQDVTTVKDAGKLPARIDLQLSRCNTCGNGLIGLDMITGTGDNVKTEKLALIEISPKVVNQFS